MVAIFATKAEYTWKVSLQKKAELKVWYVERYVESSSNIALILNPRVPKSQIHPSKFLVKGSKYSVCLSKQ